MPELNISQEYVQTREQEFLTPEQQVASRARRDILSHKDAFDALNIPEAYVEALYSKAAELDVAKYEAFKSQDLFVQLKDILGSSVATEEDKNIAATAGSSLERLRDHYKDQLAKGKNDEEAYRTSTSWGPAHGIQIMRDGFKDIPPSDEFMTNVLQKIGLISEDKGFRSLMEVSTNNAKPIWRSANTNTVFFNGSTNHMELGGSVSMDKGREGLTLIFHPDQMKAAAKLPSLT